MTATNHVLTGAAIALTISNPVVAIIVALASHFLTDMILHFAPRHFSEKSTRRIALADMIMTILTVVLVLVYVDSVSTWLLVACMAAAYLPDVAWVWRFFRLGNTKKIVEEPMSSLSRFHLNIQHESFNGGLVELAWALAMTGLIVNLS